MATLPDPLPGPALPAVLRRRAGAVARCTSAVVAHAPENAAYALMAMAPLGVAFGGSAMLLTLAGAVLANVVASVLGAGRLVSGPRASLALLTAGFLPLLMQRLGPSADAWAVPLLLAFALAGAGLLQAAFGLLRFGTIVKYTPYPVRVGLTSGIGLLLLLSALPVALGHGFGAGWSAVLQPLEPAAALVAGTALAVAWVSARHAPRLPAALLGLATGAALHALMLGSDWAASLSPRIGIPALSLDAITQAHAATLALDGAALRAVAPLLASYAVTVAVLCSLDTLLTTSVVDGRVLQVRDANRELVAQGLANVAAAAAGGQATSPSVPRSLALVHDQGPAHRHAVLLYAALLALLTAGGPQLIGLLPSSAVGGILVAQALPMISPALWRTPLELWLAARRARRAGTSDAGPPRLLASNWAVGMLVALGAVLLGLGPAVLLGASFAIILFVRANMRDVVRRSGSGVQRRSLKVRPPAVAEGLRREGGRIAVLDLEGALFFGTADALRMQLRALPDVVEIAILDLHQVQEVDVTGARILVEIAEDWQRSGRRLVFAEWTDEDPRRSAVEAVAGRGGARGLNFVDTSDLAMEQAEDALIARLDLDTGDARKLELAQTTIARGLDSHELAWLAAAVTEVRFEGGTVMFRQGDVGDALYISLQGEIGLRLPGGQRRLVSFAPGVTVGEMAVLAHGARSAEAVAESDVVALRLSVQAFDRMKREQPELAAKLLNNLALHLADRVRVLTSDLAHWVARSSAARAQTAGFDMPDPQRTVTEAGS